MNADAGKTALITGASKGIGLELAKCFAHDGYNLVLVALDNDELQRTADSLRQQFGSTVTAIQKDLSQDNAAQELYDHIKREGITINALVNNAGIGEHGKFATETGWNKEKALIHINIVSLTHLTKLYVGEMVARNEGKILNLASIASVMPNPLLAVYGASKAYVLSFSEALHNELKDTDVTVTALLPGATDTDWFPTAGAANTVAGQGKKDDPADVAKAGYEALMSGKDMVVYGAMNKAMVGFGAFQSEQMKAENARKQMEEYGSSQQEKDEQVSAIALGIGIAAVVLVGVVVASAYGYNQLSWYDKLRYGYEGEKAKRKLMNSLSMN